MRNIPHTPEPIQNIKLPNTLATKSMPGDVSPSVQLYQADKEPSQNAAYLEAKIISCGTPDVYDLEELPIPPVKEHQELEHSDNSTSDRTI